MTVWVLGRHHAKRAAAHVRFVVRRAAGSAPRTGAGGDTRAPSLPGNLRVTAQTPTSLTLAWNASSDDVGVTGYEVSRGGTMVGVTVKPGFLVTGLSCGSGYVFVVVAVDAAGNRSLPASVSARTADCVLPAASVFVSVGGSDAGGCSQAAPCRSFDRAFHVAGSGAVVEVAGGTYPAQTLTADASKTSAVVFRPASGASVTTGVISFGRNVKHVEVRDMTITRGAPSIAWEAWTAWDGGNDDITMRDITATDGTFKIESGATNIRVIGGSYGNVSSSSTNDAAYSHLGGDSHGILIDGVTIHDFRRSSSSIHMECLHISSAYDVTIRNSTFRDCAIYAIFMDTWSGSGTHDVLIENNFFDQPRNVNGGCCAYDSIWINTAMSTSNLTIRYNSFADSPGCVSSGEGCSISLATSGTLSNVRVIGNYGPARSYDCQSGVTYSHNVWKNASCGASDLSVPTLGYVNSAAVDLHLSPGASAIGHGDPADFPATDIDGNPRPGPTGTPDAGADQH
jgi:hypothetical protein